MLDVRIVCVCVYVKLLFFCVPSIGLRARTNESSYEFKNWRNNCNCSCSVKNKPTYSGCSTKNLFKIVSTNNDDILMFNTDDTVNLSSLEHRHFKCWRGKDEFAGDAEIFLIYIECPAGESERVNNYFAFFQNNSAVTTQATILPPSSNKPTLNTTKSVVNTTEPAITTSATTPSVPHQQNRTKRLTILVIGLGSGLGLVAVIIICILCVRCRNRKKQDKKQQDRDYEYIHEDEDSHPYRIVDLSTNVSCDSSGYTFLNVQREEEKPYQKLNSHHTCAEKLSPNGAGKNPIRQETGVKVLGEDEPVYFMLEGKSEIQV